MKKLIVFLLLAILLIASNLPFTENLNIFSIFDVTMVQVFTNEKNEPNEYNSIDNGSGEVYFCDKDEALNLFNSIDYITGFTMILKNEDNLIDDIIKTFNIEIVKRLSDNIYGYSLYFPFKVCLEKKQVSVQIFVRDDTLFVGCPILLGSY